MNGVEIGNVNWNATGQMTDATNIIFSSSLARSEHREMVAINLLHFVFLSSAYRITCVEVMRRICYNFVYIYISPRCRFWFNFEIMFSRISFPSSLDA